MDPHFGPVHGTLIWTIHGPHVMDRVHGHFLFKNGFKVEMIDKHYGQLQATKIAQK